jgi:hypothetical protein
MSCRRVDYLSVLLLAGRWPCANFLLGFSTKADLPVPFRRFFTAKSVPPVEFFIYLVEQALLAIRQGLAVHHTGALLISHDLLSHIQIIGGESRVRVDGRAARVLSFYF